MSKYLKYIPIILLCVGLFFCGRLTAPQPDSELLKKYEAERIFHESAMKDLNAKLVDLSNAGLHEREKRYQDSVKTIVALKAKDEAYNKLKKHYESINLSGADIPELDSAWSVIRSALHKP